MTPAPIPSRPATPTLDMDILNGKLAEIQRLIQNLPGDIVQQLRSELNVEAAPEVPATEGPNAPAGGELTSVQAGLNDVRSELAKAQGELEERIRQASEAEKHLEASRAQQREAELAREAEQKEIDAAQEKLSELGREIDAAQARLTDLHQGRDQAELLIAQAATAQTEITIAEAAKADLARLDAEVTQKKESLAAVEAQYQAYKANHENAERLLARIWPRWMSAEEFAQWRTKLEAGIFAPEPPASSTLLFAALHGYSAALRETGDPRFLLDSLRELSRRLYPWLKEQGHSEADAAERAQEWAAEINRECAGRAEVEVPIPGDPADPGWMLFPPRTGSTDVVTVSTWCVRDSQKRPINKAQVTV